MTARPTDPAFAKAIQESRGGTYAAEGCGWVTGMSYAVADHAVSPWVDKLEADLAALRARLDDATNFDGETK